MQYVDYTVSTAHEADLAVHPRLIGGALTLTYAHALFVVWVASPTLGLDMAHHAPVRYPSPARTWLRWPGTYVVDDKKSRVPPADGILVLSP